MITPLFWLTPGLSVIDWLATWRNWQRVHFIAKPGALIALIAWFTQVGSWNGPLLWFGIGLVFSLLGDIFLLFPKRLFLAGMGAFFLTHVLYIIGFSVSQLVLPWQAVFPMIALTMMFLAFTSLVRRGLNHRGENQLVVPIMVYAATISFMLLMSLSTFLRPDWTRFPSALVSIGAGLFYLSDLTLAYNRFVKPIPLGDPIVMVTYHTGQILLTAGVLMNFA